MSSDWLDVEPPPRRKPRPDKFQPPRSGERPFAGRGYRGRLLLKQCARKHRYRTEELAKKVKFHYPDSRVYACPWCKGWHPQGQAPARPRERLAMRGGTTSREGSAPRSRGRTGR